MPDDAVSTAPALSAEQVAFFHDNGFLVVRNAVPAPLIDLLRRETLELTERYRAYRDEPNVFYAAIDARSFESMIDGSHAHETRAERILWRIDKLDGRLASIDRLRAVPFIRAAATALLGPDAIHYNEAFVVKQPRRAPPVPWHQDPSFKVKRTPDPIATCDVYLDDADEQNGCLWVVPGSHKRGVADTAALMAQHGFQLPGAVPMRMQPGDVAFHDNGCLHGSEANVSERFRRIIYLAFQTLRQAELSGKFTPAEIQDYKARFDRLGHARGTE